MEVKFCPKCGASIPENANFCLSCGMNLSAITSQPIASLADTPSKTQPRNIATGNVTDLEVSAARLKSYTGIAIFVFFLYFIFYFPGLVVNYIYVQEAKKMQEKAGTSLPGVGLLDIMLWFNFVSIIVGLITFATIALFIYVRSYLSSWIQVVSATR